MSNNKTQFVSLKGRVNRDSSFIKFQVLNGDNSNSIGDQVWFSEDGTELHVYEHLDEDVFDELIDFFEPHHRRAMRGALRRVGVYFD